MLMVCWNCVVGIDVDGCIGGVMMVVVVVMVCVCCGDVVCVVVDIDFIGGCV